MNQKRLEQLRRLQLRHFLKTFKELSAEFEKFEDCHFLVRDLSRLKTHVEKIAISGDELIAFAKTVPDCVNRSESVAMRKENLDHRFNYVQHLSELAPYILRMRQGAVTAWISLRQRMKDGEAEVTEEYLNKYGWAFISLDHQINSLKDAAISIVSLYEAQLRLLKVRLWMGTMGSRSVSRYEGDDPSGARFAF